MAELGAEAETPRALQPFRGTLAGCREEQRNGLELSKGKGRVLPWARTAPGTSTGWGQPAGKQLCREGPGVLGDNELSLSQQCPGGQEGPWDPGVHQGEHCQQGREVILPLHSAPLSGVWSAGSSPGLLRTRETWRSWSGSSRGNQG